MNSVFVFYGVMMLLIGATAVAIRFVGKKIKEKNEEIEADNLYVSIANEDEITGHLVQYDWLLTWEQGILFKWRTFIWIVFAIEIVITVIGTLKHINLI